MSSVGQYESPWQIDVASWIIEVVGKVAPGVAGAAAASVSPLLAPVVTGALNAISETQSKQLEQLNQIAAAIEAQMEAPYIDGLNKLFDAKRAREETPRQERITKAIESFEVARALAQARVKTSGNERHLFRQAVTEYQIGNCRALLTQLDWASMWYQDAYSTATRYLFAEESPVRPSWNEYQRYSEILQLPPKERNRIAETLQHPPKARNNLGLYALATAALAVVGPITPALVFAYGVRKDVFLKGLERRAKEKFTEEVAPALDLIYALRQLQTSPALALKLPEPVPAWNRQEKERLYRRAIEA